MPTTRAGWFLTVMRWLSVIGVSSYSLYLLHQEIGLTLIHVVSKALGISDLAGIAVALAVALLMIWLAYAIYVAWEHPVDRWIVRMYKRRLQHPRGTAPSAGGG